MRCSSETWPVLDAGSLAHTFAERHFGAGAKLQPLPATPTTWSCAVKVVCAQGTTVGIVRLVDCNAVSFSDIEQEFALTTTVGARGIGPSVLGRQSEQGLIALRYLAQDRPVATLQTRLLAYARQVRALHALSMPERPRLLALRQRCFSSRFAHAAPSLPSSHLQAYILLTALDELLLQAGGGLDCLTHGDLNPSNLLWSGGRGWLIDYDHAGWGNPLRDIATLSLALRLTQTGEAWLLGSQLGHPPRNEDWLRYRMYCVAVLLRYGLDVATLRPRGKGNGEPENTAVCAPFDFDQNEDTELALRMQRLSAGFLAGAEQALASVLSLLGAALPGSAYVQGRFLVAAEDWIDAVAIAKEYAC